MHASDRRPLIMSLGAVAILALSIGGCSHSEDTGPPRFSADIAESLLAAGQTQAALHVANQVLVRQPHNAAALTARGDALYGLWEMDAASNAYRAALRQDPNNAGALLGLGRSLLRMDPKAAQAALLGAAKLQPDNAVVLNDLGVARDLLKDHAAAQDAYRHALALDPGSTRARMNLGLSLALSGKPAKAVAILQPLEPGDGEKSVWRANLAVALALKGDTPAAHHLLAAEPTVAQPRPLPAPPDQPQAMTAWIQLAATPSKQDAAAEWKRLQARFAALRGKTPTVVSGQVNGRTCWRLRLGGFPNLADAEAACRSLRKAGAACLPIGSPHI